MRASKRAAGQRRQGMAVCVAAALGFAAMLGGAAYADARQGVAPYQSLAAWGL